MTVRSPHQPRMVSLEREVVTPERSHERVMGSWIGPSSMTSREKHEARVETVKRMGRAIRRLAMVLGGPSSGCKGFTEPRGSDAKSGHER